MDKHKVGRARARGYTPTLQLIFRSACSGYFTSARENSTAKKWQTLPATTQRWKIP